MLTDNSRLLDEDKRSDLILNLRPGLRLLGEGRRMKLDFAYAPRITLHTDTFQRNGISHFLDFASTTDLYHDRFFIDLRANASVVNILRDVPSDIGGALNNNSTQSYLYLIRPHFRQRLKSYGVLSGDVTYRETRFPDNDLSNTRISSTHLRFDETRWVNRVDGYLDYSYRNIKRTDREDVYSSVATLGLIFHLDRFWGLTGTLGYEKGNYEVGDGKQPEGWRWNVGAIWTPSSRVRVNLAAGERFFGRDYSLDVSYRHRRSILTATYRTSFQTAGGLIGQQDNFPRLDAFGNPVSNPLGQNDNTLFGTNASLNTNEVYREDDFELHWALTGKRHRLDARAYYRNREYGETGRDQLDWGLSGNLTHSLSARSSLFGRVTWDVLTERNLDRDFTRYSLEIGFDRRLGPETRTRISVYNGAGNYSDDTRSYREHRLNASISHRF